MEISCGFGFIQFRSKMRRKFSMRIHVSDTRFRREIMSSTWVIVISWIVYKGTGFPWCQSHFQTQSDCTSIITVLSSRKSWFLNNCYRRNGPKIDRQSQSDPVSSLTCKSAVLDAESIWKAPERASKHSGRRRRKNISRPWVHTVALVIGIAKSSV